MWDLLDVVVDSTGVEVDFDGKGTGFYLLKGLDYTTLVRFSPFLYMVLDCLLLLGRVASIFIS